MTDFERVGGEAGLRRVFTDFIERVSQDFIIGFFFEGKDLDRILEMEVALARVHLGGGGRYPGRRMDQAHGSLPINAGHFRRRLAFLRTVLVDHGVPEEVIERWVAHDSSLEALVTDGTDCVG